MAGNVLTAGKPTGESRVILVAYTTRLLVGRVFYARFASVRWTGQPDRQHSPSDERGARRPPVASKPTAEVTGRDSGPIPRDQLDVESYLLGMCRERDQAPDQGTLELPTGALPADLVRLLPVAYVHLRGAEVDAMSKHRPSSGCSSIGREETEA